MVVRRSRVGRPRVEIDVEDIEFLQSLKFNWVRIAGILGISRATLYRRLDEFGISRITSYSYISDNDLDHLIYHIKTDHPHDGEQFMNGHLSALGIHVPRVKLRASIHRVDPINTALRRSIVVRRRVYHVSGPNAVWHIDGNHKLIRWRMVIHGGVDGYSRTIVYLKCAQNNRADTVMVAFNEAVDEYGLPEHVRSDLGGENVEVWRFMIEQHSYESSVITGSSTHNERIERLWRDVTRSVGSYFYATFQELELNGHLDVLNEVDMFCLHYTYIPRLNHFLKVFTECWNNYSLSSEHNQTPNQLRVQGIVHQQNQPNFTQILGQSRNLTLPAVRDTVTVPGGTFQPCRALMTSLNAVINTTTSGVEDNCKST